MRLPSRPVVLLCVVALAAVAAYLPCLAFGYAYDDGRFVEGNRSLEGLAAAPWRALDPATTTMDGPEPGMWRPLRTLSFAIDRALFDGRPGPAHLASLLLHGTAAALVFAVGTALGLEDIAAAAGAAVFALHPVQAESVAWISSRGDLLSAVLLLAAVLVHLRGPRGGPVWTAALAGLAFLSKESAAAAPLLLLAADCAAGGAIRLRERWRAALPTAAVLAGLVVLRGFVLASAGAEPGQGEGLGLGAAAAAAAVPSMFGWYALRFLVPSPGTFDLQVEPGPLLALASAAILVAAAAWPRLGLPAGGARPFRAALLGAAAALFPVTLLQVVFPLKILVADRFLYLALAGPALALGAAAGALGPAAARAALAGSCLLLLAAAPARDRWASGEALWRDTLARTPGSARALHGLGSALEAKAPEEALRLYGAAVEAEPSNVAAWFRRGLLEEKAALAAPPGPERRGNGLLAVESLHRAIRLWLGGEREGRERGLAEARLARATLLASLGEGAPAAMEAAAGYDLWKEATTSERDRLRWRMETLHRWARETGRAELLARLGGREP